LVKAIVTNHKQVSIEWNHIEGFNICKSGNLVVFVGSGVGYNQAASAFIMP